MNEQQRMIYTEAMGIDTYVPRRLLQLIPKPHRCSLPLALDHKRPEQAPEHMESERVNPLVARIVDEADNSASRSNRTQAQGADIHREPSAPVAANKQESTQENTKDVTFVLHIWQLGGSVLAIDSHQVGQALPTHALLANILIALGWKADEMPQAEALIWPPANSRPGPDKSWQAAHELVTAFLDARMQHRPTEHLLLFGEAAQLSVQGEEAGVEAYQAISSKWHKANVALLPSLAEFLHAPQRKNDLWLFLQSFFGSRSQGDSQSTSQSDSLSS